MTTKTKVTPDTLTRTQVRALRWEALGRDPDTFADCQRWLESDMQDDLLARRICDVINNAAAKS